MKTDVKGKINEKRLAYSNALLPLYEAIVNSIQSIEENNTLKDGLIEINIIRSIQKNLEFSDEDIIPQITDFIILDNGIGFTTDNYESFNHAHSTYKSGGKGIGRFTWLRAFQKAEIESVYVEDSIWYKRNFNFEQTKNGIENTRIEPIEKPTKKYTKVKLCNLKEEYQKWCNSKAEDIALKIIEHAFIYLLNKNCPIIKIIDDSNILIVNDLFLLYTKEKVESSKVKIGANSYQLKFVNLYSGKVDNKIHYCANSREVISDKIALDIPEFDNFLLDNDNNKFSIGVYVQGDYLDQKVNEERTSINFYKGDVAYPDETVQEDLRKAITNKLSEQYSSQITTLSEVRINKVKKIVNEHPRYKQLIKYKYENLKTIPSTYSDDRIELELFKIQQELELEVKKETTRVFKFIEKEEDMLEFEKKHQELYTKIIEVGNSKLSEYVIHRKLVIDLFGKMLKMKAKESAVHSLIFPLKTYSDDIGFEDHNLWMLDEKLAYHKYLASDKSWRKIEPVDSDSLDRPDIIVFNKPFAFANDEKPYQSIVLIEFKKPMRNDYTDVENPIAQINKYAREIINSEAKDKNERDFGYRKNTPIYAYIVCDITAKLKEFASDASYKLFPNEDGYFSFNENYNMYIEILSFDKILKDSKDRNRVLFEKLNIL
jgi:hypothetical protein